MQKLLSLDPAKLILSLAVTLALVVFALGAAVGLHALTGGLISVVFLALGGVMHFKEGTTRDTGVATALVGQAVALTAAFEGHPWQIDTHMLFFALLACLIVLRSVPAILMGTAIIAVHHLSFSVFFPALVYPGGDMVQSLSRTFFHAVIVLVEASVLVMTVLLLQRMANDMRERNAELEVTVEQSNQARAEAEKQRQSAEKTKEQAQAAQAQTEQLLEEAKASEKRRAEAEAERQRLQDEAAEDVERNAAEQALVGEVLREAMMRLQKGDLTTRIDRQLPAAYRDIGVAFNEAVSALDAAVRQVAVQSEDMRVQVSEIATAAAELAKRTEQQAHMLRESSEGLGELTNVVSKTEASVREADASANSARDSAKASETVVAETSEAMQAIQTEAEEISQIVKVIDEIAFQTNLLALNAGVEAARAGEAGRGFAVVASEVRALAQRSSDSATTIRGLIERSGQQVQRGSAKIEDTVGALSAVIAAVLEITSKTDGIAKGTQEQSAEISVLNRKVSDLDVTTQQNAAMFEETSAACTSLEGSASFLRDLTRNFTVSDDHLDQSAAA